MPKSNLKELLDKREYWWWAEQARSSRLDYLRKAVWSKATKGAAYLPGIKICEYGPVCYARAFGADEAASTPYMLTWAKALTYVNDEIPAFIVDKSRIVGYCGSAPHKLFWVPNGSYSLNEDFFNDKDNVVDDDVRDEVWNALKTIKPH
ncbi:MAG: hypothetical protein J7K32_00125, partial [Deltaproteobacteria bacterium]|nr:hypothetical protein [Deltaproteobacteria bacterium]